MAGVAIITTVITPPLVKALLVVAAIVDAAIVLVCGRLLELLDTTAESAHEFGDLAPSEQKQDDQDNDDDLGRAK